MIATLTTKIKADAIKSRIADAYAELSKLQSTCTHPNLIVTNHGDTGNYDPSQDCYWTQNHCPDCGKHWRGEQS